MRMETKKRIFIISNLWFSPRLLVVSRPSARTLSRPELAKIAMQASTHSGIASGRYAESEFAIEPNSRAERMSNSLGVSVLCMNVAIEPSPPPMTTPMSSMIATLPYRPDSSQP